MLVLDSDYGTWRATMAYRNGALLPASFWLAALEGVDAPPSPAVTAADLTKFADRLALIVESAARLAPIAEQLGERFEAAWSAEHRISGDDGLG
ncbi:MAG TPA: hypothetical protein VF426_07640 [Marmoricola sp.]